MNTTPEAASIDGRVWMDGILAKSRAVDEHHVADSPVAAESVKYALIVLAYHISLWDW